MHTMYIDLVVGEGTTLLIKTLEINYKYQLKSYLVQKIKFEFDMGLNVPSFTCIDFFS